VRKAVRNHINKVGEARFKTVMGLAAVQSRRLGGLVGMDKIRQVIAFEAAMRLTGYPDQPLVLDWNSVGSAPTQEAYDAANALLEKVVAALQSDRLER